MRAQDSIEELAVKLKQSSMVEQDDMKASFAKVSQSYTGILISYKYLYLLYFRVYM